VSESTPLIDAHAHFYHEESGRADWRRVNDARMRAGEAMGLTYHVVDLIFVAQLAAGATPRRLDGVAAIEWHDPLVLDPARLAFASMTWALAAFQQQRRG